MVPDHDIVVSGLGVIDDDDHWRSELFQGWLEQIFAARSDGLPIRAAFLDPSIDGYSVGASRFVNAGTFTRSRDPKPSFRWVEAQQ